MTLPRPPQYRGKEDCQVCGGLGFVRHDVPVGHPDFGRLFPCACWAAELQAEQAAQAPQLTNMLPHELHRTLDNLLNRGKDTPAMIAAVRAFADAPHGMLTLWGGKGNGKTLALQALTNHFHEQWPGQAIYAPFVELMDWVRAGYDPSAEVGAQQRYERLIAARFVAIDEMDKANMTSWAFEFRTKFLDRRYRLAREVDPLVQCHTVIAMNVAPSELPEYITDRLEWNLEGEGGFRIIHNGDASARKAGL